MYITHIYTQTRQEYDNRDEYLARIACSMIIKIIYNQENQSCQDEWDKKQEECTCQGEQNNHGKSRIDQYHQHANVTNGYSNQAYKITTSKSSMRYDHSSIEKHKGKVSINRLIKFHICLNLSSSLTLYLSPAESLFCGHRIFARCVPTRWRDSLFYLFMKIWFLEQDLESLLIFVLFLKGKTK